MAVTRRGREQRNGFYYFISLLRDSCESMVDGTCVCVLEIVRVLRGSWFPIFRANDACNGDVHHNDDARRNLQG